MRWYNVKGRYNNPYDILRVKKYQDDCGHKLFYQPHNDVWVVEYIDHITRERLFASHPTEKLAREWIDSHWNFIQGYFYPEGGVPDEFRYNNPVSEDDNYFERLGA